MPTSLRLRSKMRSIQPRSWYFLYAVSTLGEWRVGILLRKASRGFTSQLFWRERERDEKAEARPGRAEGTGGWFQFFFLRLSRFLCFLFHLS